MEGAGRLGLEHQDGYVKVVTPSEPCPKNDVQSRLGSGHLAVFFDELRNVRVFREGTDLEMAEIVLENDDHFVEDGSVSIVDHVLFGPHHVPRPQHRGQGEVEDIDLLKVLEMPINFTMNVPFLQMVPSAKPLVVVGGCVCRVVIFRPVRA
jgi:hypothetical protein